MAVCTYLLEKEIGTDCTNPIVTGLKKIGYIINKDDIASITRDASNHHLITAISLATGKKAYHIYQNGNTPFTGTKSTAKDGKVSGKFDHVVSFIVGNDGPDVNLDIIDKLNNGKFVVIVEKEYTSTTGNNVFQVFGTRKGMVRTALEQDPYSADTDGGWNVELTETDCPVASDYIFDTSIATTRTALEALC